MCYQDRQTLAAHSCTSGHAVYWKNNAVVFAIVLLSCLLTSSRERRKILYVSVHCVAKQRQFDYRKKGRQAFLSPQLWGNFLLVKVS